MRPISAAFFVSVDGVVGSPQDWHFPYLSPQLANEVATQTAGAAALLLGRRTYQEWAGHWPHQDPADPLAAHLNAIPKLVASRTLTGVEWQNSTLLEGDAVTAVARLAQQHGPGLAVGGSPTLARALLTAGLITELRLVMHPLVVGTGQRLFPDGYAPLQLTLSDVQQHDNGVLVLAYHPREAT